MLKYLALLFVFEVLLTGVHTHPHTASKQVCTHDASARNCWGDYDISTDYYDVIPDTGVIREYWFNIVNTTAAPDGFERVVLSVNGSVPGPTIVADWGDTVVVHVTNFLENNGTSIHWHGVRQNMTNYMDGVPAITQCPIALGHSFTYRWRASQYGSSWYHSHFAVQAWDGIFGGIQINGPATANYDEDKGVLILSDWSHKTAPVLALESAISGPPPQTNGLINGTNVFNGTGSRFETNFVAGTSYRLRLINSAADTHFRFSIDDHILTVISNDFVPIVPYNTTNLSIGIGQRYDVIVHTNKTTTGDFWIRAVPQKECSTNENRDNIRGIVRYNSSSTLEPNTSAYTTIDSCSDEESKNLVPYLSIPVASTPSAIERADANLQRTDVGTVRWAVNGTSFVSQWKYPTLLQSTEGNNTWTKPQIVVKLSGESQWVYFVITSPFNRSHPIHIHGHDFWVLAAGTGAYQSNLSLQFVNGPRRDVVMMPAVGYIVLAILTDNPGAWLVHCHIAWHASEGFALQFLEREDEIESTPGIVDTKSLNELCEAWDKHIDKVGILQDDSGV
ncbi:Bgt-1212 [Blumeria graminis f. sp. tritici]|uniref:laccase n=2 Tax=Blumeria graminis f. sp. tritici TaxID=62690 RepID=A0A9X9MP15_BLUGR|nr:Ferro-O2-oxidoreductase [Blumeria graminis f. sp. tritici 96224]VDB93655.1 Bgt-1212 [Blumeria graminis f. sp. tritici]